MLTRRLRYWFRSARRAAALRQEMEHHIDEKAAELRAVGLPDPDARAAARRLFGNPSLHQEDSREIWLSRRFSEFSQDLRYGARTLAAQPAFTLAAVLALVLGIGVNAFVFNVYNALAWEPWAIRDPQSTVQVLWQRQSGRWLGFSWPHFDHLRAHTRSLTGLAADLGLDARVTRGEAVWDAEVGAVSAGFFDLLAPAFTLGRGLSAAPAPEVVLSHTTWQTRFAADPAVLGQWIHLNRQPFQIVGVAAPGFNGATITRTDLWIAARGSTLLRPWDQPLDSPDSCCVSVVGRLKPGVPRAAAEAELATLNAQYLASLGRPPARLILAAPSFLANPTRSRQLFPIFLAISVTAVLILILACSNVANLQLARAVARRPEIRLRILLGAGRARILRQLLVESLCISSLAGLASLAISTWLPGWTVRQLLGPDEHLTFSFANDGRVLVFVAATTFLASLLFGLAPAWTAIRGAAAGDIREGARATAGSRARTVLMAVQVALCTILLSGTALLVRSLDRVRQVDIGLPQDQLLVMSTRFDASGLTPPQSRTLLASLMDRTAQLPGVQSVALASRIPFGERCSASAQDPAAGARVPVTMHEVSANFFDTLRVPVLLGRDFTRADAGRQTILINEAAAQRFWPGESPIGKTLQLAAPSQVIGVVRNFGTADFGSQLDVYQVVESAGRCDNLLVIRHQGAEASLLADLPKQSRGLDSRFILSAVPYTEVIAKARRPADLAATIATVLGGLSLLLACVGVYGVAAYGVSRRTRELGIRIALGARPRKILWMVLRHNLRTVAIGAAAGIAGAIAFGRLLRSLLYGVSPSDPLALALTIAVLAATAAIAVWGPARRAARTDPANTLRHE